jgi:hypothetical protein
MRNKLTFIEILVMFFLMIVVITSANAGDVGGDYHEKIDTFFSKIKDGKTEEAIDFIFSDNPWFSKNPEDIEKVKNTMINFDKMIGKYQDHEKLTEKIVANRFAHLYYFVAYERQPFAFIFQYYKPKDKWMLSNFQGNPNLGDEIAGIINKDILSGSK